MGGPPNAPFSPPASRTGPHHTVRTTVVQLVGLATVAVGGALAASLGGLWWGALAAAIAVDLGLVSLVVPPVPQQSRRRYHPPRS